MEYGWEVLFYETDSGSRPVENFYHLQSVSTKAKINKSIELLARYGPQVRMPYARYLVSKLCELRILGKENIRILYSIKERKIYLLHAFKKKTQQISKKELRTGLNRLTEI